MSSAKWRLFRLGLDELIKLTQNKVNAIPLLGSSLHISFMMTKQNMQVNIYNTYRVYTVECVATIASILSINFYAMDVVVYFQFTHYLLMMTRIFYLVLLSSSTRKCESFFFMVGYVMKQWYVLYGLLCFVDSFVFPFSSWWHF